jgi:hypothetical protein
VLYPVRVERVSNTNGSLLLMIMRLFKNELFQNASKDNAIRLFQTDENCRLREPSGTDFLSRILEEINI